MTINIGINLGQYVILGADTRTVFYRGNKIVNYKDEDLKIQETKAGLITGAGYLDLLDDVKQKIAETDIDHTDQIFSILKESRRNIAPKLAFFYADIKKPIGTTSWLFTYFTIVNDSPTMRLSLIHPQFNDQIASYLENTSCVVMPGEATPEQADRVTDTVNKNIKSLEALPDLNKNINYHVTLIRGVIKAASEDFESVSPSYQIGIHTADGKTGISDIIKNGGFTINLK